MFALSKRLSFPHHLQRPKIAAPKTTKQNKKRKKREAETRPESSFARQSGTAVSLTKERQDSSVEGIDKAAGGRTSPDRRSLALSLALLLPFLATKNVPTHQPILRPRIRSRERTEPSLGKNMGVQAQAPLNDITTQNANETKNTL